MESKAIDKIVKIMKINKTIFMETYIRKECLQLLKECHSHCREDRKEFICVYYHCKEEFENEDQCHDPSFGLTTKARVCKGVGQEGSLGVTFHAPENVGKMNPHIPKWAPTLGIRVSINSQIFKEVFQASKFIGLKSSLHH